MTMPIGRLIIDKYGDDYEWRNKSIEDKWDSMARKIDELVDTVNILVEKGFDAKDKG